MVYLTGANFNVVFDLFFVIIIYHFKVFFGLSLKQTHKKYEKALIITAYIQIIVNSTNLGPVLCTSPVEKLSINNSKSTQRHWLFPRLLLHFSSVCTHNRSILCSDK
jgi:hypothetical protein